MDDLILRLPDHILHQPCTDREEHCREILLLVSQRTLLTPCTLGRWLFVEENEIQAIQQDSHALPANERKYMVILKWINSNGSKANYYSLIRALYSGNDVPTAELITNKLTPEDETPVSMTRHFQDTEQRTPIILQDVKRLPTLGTPSSEIHSLVPSTPFSPNLPTFFEPTEEENNQRQGSMCLSHQKTEGLVLPTSGVDQKDFKDSSDSIHEIKQETVDTVPASTLSSQSCRPASLEIPPDCPAHQNKVDHSLNFTDTGTPFEKMPVCASQFGQLLQQKMNATILEYKAKAHAAFVNYQQLQENYDYVINENHFQKEELTRRGAKMQKLIVDTQHIHSENHQLKQELELNQDLLKLICGTLEAWRDDVKDDYAWASLQHQIESLLQSESTTIIDSLVSVQHEHCKLKAEKEKLEKNLDDIISMYAEKQRLLKALMEEKHQLEQQADYQQGELSKLKQRVVELMEKNDEILAKNKELEKRVAILEQEKSELTNKCKELEQKQILVLVSKPVKTDGVLGIMRSRSEGTYTEVNQPTLTSFFSEDHKRTGCIGHPEADEVCCQAASSSEKEVKDELCIHSDSTPSLAWIQTFNEMVKLCDEGSISVLEGVHNIEMKLKSLKISQKLQKRN